MIITKTPLRVSLCGGGTDYPGWFQENGGIVVGGAIDKYSHISARWLPPFHNFKTRVVYNQIETVNDNADIEHRAIRMCLETLGIQDGVELIHSCDIPGRSGTGSSSTFMVGTLKALASLLQASDGKQRLMSPEALAKAAIEIEREKMAEDGGWQDQIWAAYGGLNIIKFRGDDFNVIPLTLSCSQVRNLESHLLLYFTGISRNSNEVAASYAPSLGQMREQQTAMMRVTDNCIDALYTDNLQKVGHWIDAGWRIKSSLSDKVSSTTISSIYSIARLHGAWGGKLVGAGGGGCVLLVAPPDKHAAIHAAMSEQGCIWVPFTFEHAGSQVIFYGR